MRADMDRHYLDNVWYGSDVTATGTVMERRSPNLICRAKCIRAGNAIVQGTHRRRKVVVGNNGDWAVGIDGATFKQTNP